MPASPVKRRLAAILAADVAGYSRMIAEDEEATLHTLGAYRTTIGDLIVEHGGRVFGTAGDSVIAEFASAVQAVRTAVAIQRALQRHNADLPVRRRLEFRIGINLGDVVAEGEDVLGDGVNIAARLQEVAVPAGICLSGAVREQIEGKLDFPLAALGERTLKNIPRPVAVYRVDWAADVLPTTVLGGAAPTLPDKPSMAVLPFANLSGDPEQDYFVDGITEDIITALSHYRWFFVIARNSTFAYKGRPGVDVKQVARELGVRYVLEGSVRKAGSLVRATAQLIEAETGKHLWAERFDRDVADIFTLQDEITHSVVGAIEPEMLLVEGGRAARKSVANPDAFDCCMRGVWHFHQLASDDNEQAEIWLRRSIELDPKLAHAHMALARTLINRIWSGWSRNVDQDLSDAHAAATRAVSLDDRDPYAYYVLSVACVFAHRHKQALSAAQRAIDLNPNFALGYFALGWTRVFIGHFSEAVDALLYGLRLSPNDPRAHGFLSQLALAQYHRGDYEEAARSAERALSRGRWPVALRMLLAALGQLGRTEEAGKVREELERIKLAEPGRYWEATMCHADPTHQAHLLEGLRKAGMQV
jgi:TolB-like protein/class 3 adenylate cyclase/cytochrome c-type biogenesis protein CcmH/NrfG